MGRRALRHRKSSETTSRLGGLGSALAFIGGSGAVIASQLKGSLWVVLAGLIGAAVSAFAINRDALRRDRANADRYEKMQVALDGLAERVDDVAALIATEPKALLAFTDTVTDLLATEHKQWLEGTAQAEASLVKLDAQLASRRRRSNLCRIDGGHSTVWSSITNPLLSRLVRVGPLRRLVESTRSLICRFVLQ